MKEANATTSNGEHVFPTVAASEFKGAQAQKDKAGGYVLQRVTGNNGNQVLPTFVAADSKGCRVHSARDGKYALHVFTQVSAATTNSNGGHAMPTIAASEWRGPQGEKDRNGGYVLVPFVKTSHARGRDGEGERRERREVVGTRNVFDGERPQEVVVVRPRPMERDGEEP